MPPRRRRGPRVENNVGEQTEGSVGNPPPPPPPPLPQPNEREYIKAFRKENPPKFDGLGEPPKAEAWVRDIERIFEFMGCTDRERLACVTYQLTGPADFWWETKKRTMDPARREALTWEDFKEEVYNKYVPESYRRAKVVEFHTLKQGSMTVTEYDRALCEMTRYAPELVDTDEKMAAKFRSGLRTEIRVAVASRRGIPYSEVLGCALDVEEALPKNERTTNPTPSAPQANFREKRKWEGNRVSFDNKRRFSTFRQPQNHGRQIVPQQRGNPQRTPYCNRCSKHHVGECRVGGIRCYACGGNGHMSRECPNNNKSGVKNGQGQRPPQQPQPIRQVAPQQARAYALKGNQGKEPQAIKDKENLAG
ncbi:uncharacterized protein LOC121763888 [Salvia splendens]|uniref:uncharacterized protein LOC121763888 n=1 Tax=Salvia splendens TaxID=180675 RepID=UPI001C27ECE0|nr:uncharacterized protein LOC121763888 [Salvia splendens]